MANKRRAKKYKVPYKRYGPNGIISTKISAREGFASALEQNYDEDEKSGPSSYYYYQSKQRSNSSRRKKDDEEGLFYTYSYGNNKKKDNYHEEATDGSSDKNNLTNGKQKQKIEVSEDSKGGGMIFPAEVFEIILEYCAQPDGINLKFFLVCKLFYKISMWILHEKPKLNSYNFNLFVDSMTNPSIVSYVSYEVTHKYFDKDRLVLAVPSSNIKRNLKYSKTPLVKSLDLANIVQAGKNSNITKILRRCSGNLQEIVAPQTSFGITSLNILKMCSNLVKLDLSLVSETVNLLDLFNSIKALDKLKVLKFPRSSINCNLDNQEIFGEVSEHEKLYHWPRNLRHLKLSGGVTNEFLMDLKFPSTLRILEFQHCPLLNDYSIYYLLSKIGLSLVNLSILYPMPSLKDNSLDFIFKYCPFLETLDLFVDYISQWCFNEVNFPWIVNAKYLPNFNQNHIPRENILIGAKKDKLAEKYKFDDDDDEDLALKRDIIISTTVNYFEDDGDENDDDNESSELEDGNRTEGAENLEAPINDSVDTLAVPTSNESPKKTKAVTPLKETGLQSLRPLRALYLGSSGTLGQANKIHPDDLIIALGESRLPNLRTLQVSNRVGWSEGDESMSQLADLLADNNNGTVYMCP